jgi:ferredoxin
MMEATKAALRELAVPSEQIKTEAFGTVKRNPAARGNGFTEIVGKVSFQASETTTVVRNDETLLDAADNAGLFIDNACRSGTCGSCRIKLVSGRVSMAVEDALTTQDKADGYILACQAKVKGDVKVDA